MTPTHVMCHTHNLLFNYSNATGPPRIVSVAGDDTGKYLPKPSTKKACMSHKYKAMYQEYYVSTHGACQRLLGSKVRILHLC